MGDHLEALERLARMRGDGTLTEEEFQSEKAKLLTAPAKESGTLAHSWEGTEEVRRSLWSSLKWPIVALAILIPIFGYFAWPHLRSMKSEEAVQVVVDSVDAPQSESGSASGKAEDTTSDALALTNDWLVGDWALDGICASDFTMSFESDGTYETVGFDKGLYSTDGKSIRFYRRRTVPEVGDMDAGFPPKALGEEISPAQPLSKNSMLLNGQQVIRC